ncbi:putative ABC transport system permease protein [Lentzea waywayandensis]|uniref:Putative ABC transport system permease protein n=1 Tax=Lentzea waywayandensis TaxID=84724 RepID=A0A1I6ESD0_9PSEU|nr:FtsX-like permease family protein [Lentzea waywayandensis]SFR20703.1 putative ABC transport system permease protein [Lentzea waywayandensis]
MLKTILAGLRARTARLVLSSIAIALGVAFVTGTLVLGDAVGEQTRDNFARSARNVDAAVHLGENSPDRDKGIPADFVQKIRNTPGVEGADSREFGSAALLSGEGKARGAMVQPLPTTEKLRDFNLKDGKFPVKADEAAIDVKTAQVAKLKVGDKLKLLDEENAEHAFTIVGTYQQGASSISMSGSDHVLVSPEGLRTVIPEQRIYEIVAVAKPGVSQQQLVSDITKAIGSGYEVQTGEQLTQATLEQVGDAAGEIKTFLLAFAAISLVVAGMVIYNTFTILVAQRTKELALLRCVGANRSQVFRSVLAEALFMGLTASVLGLLGGVGVSAALQAFISTVGGPGGEDAPIRLPISWVTIAAGFGVGVVVTVLSAVLPARRATKVAPVAALRSQPDSSDDVARTGKLRIIVATLIALAGGAAVYFGLQQEKEEPAMFITGGATMVLLLAVLLLGPLYVPLVNRLFGKALRGVPAKLASANAGRNPKRTAATTAALMIGVTIVAMVTVVAGSGRATMNEQVDKRFPADYAVKSNVYSQPLSQKFTDDLAKVRNVAQVAPELRAYGESPKLQYADVTGYPTDAIGSLVRPDTAAGTLTGLKDNEIAMREKEAKEAGLTVGSTVPISGKDFKVVALIKDNSYGTGIVTLAAAQSLLKEPVKGYQNVLVKLAPGTDITVARADLERFIATSPVAVLDSAAETKAELNGQIDQILMFIWALVGLALIIALFGIANTLTLSVLERTRESALLRALGLTRGQLRQMLVVESILMALIGAVVGVLLGAGFGWLLVEAISNSEFTISFSIPFGQIGIMLGLAVVAAIIAAALPARRAARNSVVAGMAEA